MKVAISGQNMAQYIVPKGFVCIDGTSLTVCDVFYGEFLLMTRIQYLGIHHIYTNPHTYIHTYIHFDLHLLKYTYILIQHNRTYSSYLKM